MTGWNDDEYFVFVQTCTNTKYFMRQLYMFSDYAYILNIFRFCMFRLYVKIVLILLIFILTDKGF
jgi:hypothetical protein